MKARRQFQSALLAVLLFPQAGGAQDIPTDIRQEIGKYMDGIARKEVAIGHIKVDSVAINQKTLQIFANMNCSYIPFREDNVSEIYAGVKALLPPELASYKLEIHTNKKKIEDLIPLALRNKPDKKIKTFAPAGKKPLVERESNPYTPTNGLHNRHIALWQSHGFYYEQKLTRWEWQRGRLLQTVEDLYTQSPIWYPCWRMQEPMYLFHVSAICKRKKSLLTTTAAYSDSHCTLNKTETSNGQEDKAKDLHTCMHNTQALPIRSRTAASA